MAIEIRETFQVRAPIEAVWSLVMDPHAVVTCLPGAQLDEVVDERTFLGTVKVKLGAITTSYKGRVVFADVDAQGHRVTVTAEGREAGGGIAKATLSSQLRALPDGQTEVIADATVDLTGRIMQVGRGMIEGVAHQLFLQFVAAVTQRLDVPPVASASTAPNGPGRAAEGAAIRIVPLILHVLWSAITSFVRRLFRRGTLPR